MNLRMIQFEGLMGQRYQVNIAEVKDISRSLMGCAVNLYGQSRCIEIDSWQYDQLKKALAGDEQACQISRDYPWA